MAEIWVRNGVSCQSLTPARANIANATSRTDDLTLDRAGAFLGISACIDSDAGNVPSITQTVSVGGGTTELTYGLQITSIRSVIRNSSGAAQNIAPRIIVYVGI